MDFNYTIDDISGMNAFYRFMRKCPTGGTSVKFERAFSNIQQVSLRRRWALVVRDLLPVTDPNNEPEAFLVCNAIRHIDARREHPSGRSFSSFYSDRPCISRFADKVPSDSYYGDFRHFAFAKVARAYPGTVLEQFCRMVTDPHPELVGKKDSHDCLSLFYSGLD